MKPESPSARAAPPAVGADVTPAGVRYRVWAPDLTEIGVQVDRVGTSRKLPLTREEDGYWVALDASGRPGDRYLFQFADGRLRPDPASRFQPAGVHGPSECVEASAYAWQCRSWIRPRWSGQTIYELHLGTFTPAGTYQAALARLDHVCDLGAEAIELMPVADFAGDRNWGYDGVALYAPARVYGRPDELRALVDGAHERGLAVILDVVYNHLGPAGNYLADFSDRYFRPDQTTPWGHAFNLDGESSRPVRDFLLGNATYWLDEFQFDGLRLDATHAIPDHSPRHLIAEIAAAVHRRGGFVIAEDERNQADLLSETKGGGLGLDAVWADDFHHQVRVALTGTQWSYFRGYRGTAGDLASTLMHGWTYRGQPYPPWDGRRRGSPCAWLPPRAFVVCIENHDQVGNRARGERLEHLVSARQFRAASLLLCLCPYAPLIFMGQEWGATSPFLFFTDHGGELGAQVSAGRQREFPGHAQSPDNPTVPDPEAPATFARSRLRWEERAEPAHAATLALYRAGLRERHRWLRGPAVDRGRWQVYVDGEFFAIRYELAQGDRMLLVTLHSGVLPASFLTRSVPPPSGTKWRVVLQSEAEKFGGAGRLPANGADEIQGPVTLWLAAEKKEARNAAE